MEHAYPVPATPPSRTILGSRNWLHNSDPHAPQVGLEFQKPGHNHPAVPFTQGPVIPAPVSEGDFGGAFRRPPPRRWNRYFLFKVQWGTG